jgi:hypothetical protein
MSYKACPGVTAITVKAGQAIKATVTWTNTGSQAYNFDIVIAMGDYDPTTGNFSGKVIAVAWDQPSNPGQQVTTTVTSPALGSEWVRATAYDVAVFICDATVTDNTVNLVNRYDTCLALDMVTVTS